MRWILGIMASMTVAYQVLGIPDNPNWSLYFCSIFYLSMILVSGFHLYKSGDMFYVLPLIIFLVLSFGLYYTEITNCDAYKDKPVYTYSIITILIFTIYGYSQVKYKRKNK